MAEKKKANILKLGFSLGLIASIAAVVLAVVFSLTREDREKTKEEKEVEALSAILPGIERFGEQIDVRIEEGTVTFFPGFSNGKLKAFAAKGTSPKGYGGKLTVMLGMDDAGIVGTVIVTENNETPGLGSNVTDRKRSRTIFDFFGSKGKHGGLPENKVLDSFRGIDMHCGPWKVKKDGGSIDTITGATISSRAVTDAVNIISKAFAIHKEEILSATDMQPEKLDGGKQ